VDFELAQELVATSPSWDDFIERENKPLQAQDDNERFFDHRREDARTEWGPGRPAERGVGSALLAEMRRRADAAGHESRFRTPRISRQ
jgi:acyl-CoA dehydrogenase